MQKVKRKITNDSTASAGKKKKVSFVKDDSKEKIGKTFHKAEKGKDKSVLEKKPKFQKLEKAQDKPVSEKRSKFDKGTDKSGSEKKPKFLKAPGKGNFKDKGQNGFSKGPGKGGEVTEKPVWSELKKGKKDLRLERRKAKATAPVFEISHKAKLLAAQIQRKVIQQSFRISACKELHAMIKGQYKKIALTHDLSRVIQVLLKHSEADIRTEISEELLDIIVQMVQSKYAHHSAKRILKYGTDFIRHEVIKKFLGNILSLASHKISAPLLDYAYTEFATQKEKLHMQQEFYGDIYKNTKDDSVKTLSDTYKNSPEMKGAILTSCKANVQRILDKNLHDSELLHSVLYDYMCECSANDRTEMVTTLSPLIVPISNSLPGVNAASICVWQGTNKDKKTILKVVKEHAVALSTHKTGYRLLLAIFDSVDDTVLVKKAIVSTLAKSIKDLAKDHWGKMTLHWLVKPDDTAAFHPSLVKQLKEGAKSGSSKKDPEVRVAELREAVGPAIQAEITADPQFWLADPTIALLTATVLSTEATKEVLTAISGVICDPDWCLTKDEKKVAGIEDAGMHMCLKKMATSDKGREGYTFGEALGEQLTDDTLKVWLPTNRGCFILLKAIENNTCDVADKLKQKIKPLSGLLKKQTTPGAKLLLKNIDKKK